MHTDQILRLAAIAIACIAVKGDDLVLHLLSQDVVDAAGAQCLDGSQPGFYYKQAQQNKADPKWNSSWVIYLQGGGFCTGTDDCLERSQTDLGSSKNWPQLWGQSGLLDPSGDVNPFYYFNRVFVPYCDGFFFTSNRDAADDVNGVKLYARGKRILEAVLDVLQTDYGLDQATDVLVSGGSAGGVATYMQADYISSKLQPAVVKAAPTSGFFPVVPDYRGGTEFLDAFLAGIGYNNASGGLEGNPCAEVMEPAGRCLFTNNSYNYMQTRVFPINSALDLYSLENIWQGDLPCAESEFKDCTDQQIGDLEGWRDMFMDTISSADAFVKDGNGAFIETCFEHCAAEEAAAFDGMVIDKVALKDAIWAWWIAPSTAKASEHTFLPCNLTDETPHQCNPSCSSVDSSLRRGFFN